MNIAGFSDNAKWKHGEKLFVNKNWTEELEIKSDKTCHLLYNQDFKNIYWNADVHTLKLHSVLFGMENNKGWTNRSPIKFNASTK